MRLRWLQREYMDEKLKNEGSKDWNDKKKRLYLDIEEFKEWDELDLPDKNLQKVAAEVDECMISIKNSYTKIEGLNEVLIQKLILFDRAGKVENAEKFLNELSNALQEYLEKWALIKMDNKETLMKVNIALMEEQKKVTSSLAVCWTSYSNDSFIRFNQAPDPKKECSLLEVNVFIEQATYNINTGFKKSLVRKAVIYTWQAWSIKRSFKAWNQRG